MEEGLVKVENDHIFIVNQKIKMGDWTYSKHSNKLVYVGTKGHADLGNSIRIRPDGYVRKIIGHSGIKQLEDTNLVQFIVYGDEKYPSIDIIKR